MTEQQTQVIIWLLVALNGFALSIALSGSWFFLGGVVVQLAGLAGALWHGSLSAKWRAFSVRNL